VADRPLALAPLEPLVLQLARRALSLLALAAPDAEDWQAAAGPRLAACR